MSCLFCDRINVTTFYSLNKTRTLHSMTPVKQFFEKIVGIPVRVEESQELFCESCYDSFNNIDEMEMKIKEISNDMRCRYKKRRNIKERIIISSANNSEIFSVITLDDNSDYFDDGDGITVLPRLNHKSYNSKIQEELDIQKKKIHFSNQHDLKNILSMRVKSGEESIKCNDDEGDVEGLNKLEDITDVSNCIKWEDRDVEGTTKSEDDDVHDPDVSILYDMMEERNVELILDQNTKSPAKTSSTTCTKCDLEFSSKRELKLHSATHAEDKPYICEVCGKVYRHKSALNIHIGIHKGNVPFQCSLCDKTFTQKGAMVRHYKIHTGEKPYQCEECGKRYTHHTSFTIHKISHSGKKSYKCDVCGLMLMSTSHLKRHMRVHTGEKRYSCTVCGKRFAEKYNLVSHSKLHSNESVTTQKRKFRCEHCNLVFYKRLHLEDHITKIHSAADNNYDYSEILCEQSSEMS